MKLDKNKVLVAMSGGVDSSVALAKLHEQGYTVIGITLKLWESVDPITKKRKNSNCNSIEAINGAKMVCDRLGVHHYTLDHIDSFKKNVVDDFTKQYLDGRTPNPCVRCNSYVKWGNLIEQADKFGAYYIATGHYAQIERIGTNINMKKGVDNHKDQSYMLWDINRNLLDRTLLPIGELTKEEVRGYAKNNELETSDIPDSQDLCFVMDGDYRDFLNQYMPEKMQNISNGDIKDEDGAIVGNHTGFTNYTVGQRKGLGLSFPEPRYVKKINPITNTITISKKESLYSNKCFVKNINWLIDPPCFPLSTSSKIRYNSVGANAVIEKHNDDYIIIFEEPQLAITPGQSIVFYNEDILIGGGVIEKYNE
tara:strand:+ start:4188 stop:5285 length:1098 start_codon:yes stop_codon:yes gene_type:complete